MKKLVCFALAFSAAWLALRAQDIRGTVVGTAGQKRRIGIPDFRGSGDAQKFMAVFNQTLWDDIKGAGIVEMVAKTMYPTFVPQQPSDFQTPPSGPPTHGGGHLLTDWSGPPPQLDYMAFGYAGTTNGVFVLSGWFYDARPTVANHEILAKRYTGTSDEAGARKTAHEFAEDIIASLGGKSVFGTHIYFVSSRTGKKEIWVMDPDGKNQRQITHFNSTTIQPTVSPDGSKIAFTSYARGTPGIFIFSVDPIRDLRYYNQNASVNETPAFTPDGKQIVYASSASGRCCRIYIAGLDGKGLRPISNSTAIDVEPKINPKTGSEIVFVSGRSGPQQIYRMNMDGADVERLTPGNGEASNPCWHPSGQQMAFAWTQGYATGNFNIFVMTDLVSHQYVQLTHGEGRNENPSWAPDGVHLVFMSTRSGSKQIWSMLADGSQPQQLTTQGVNESPSWGK